MGRFAAPSGKSRVPAGMRGNHEMEWQDQGQLLDTELRIGKKEINVVVAARETAVKHYGELLTQLGLAVSIIVVIVIIRIELLRFAR